MAQDNKDARVATGISITAAAAAALASIQSRRVGAAPPKGELVLPEEFVQLIIAMATSADTIEGQLEQMVKELASLSISIQGWPANTDSLTALRVVIPVAGIQLPSITIPSGMALVIKAWALNPGDLQVGGTIAECTNINQSFTLLPSEIVGYQVQNSDQIYIAATVAGCFANLTVEQRRRGGA